MTEQERNQMILENEAKAHREFEERRKKYKYISPELRKAIAEYLIENTDSFQILCECMEHFRPYIFDNNGGYAIGGETVADFIRDCERVLAAR